MKIKELSLVTIAIGLSIIYVNFNLFSKQSQIFATLNLVAIIIILGIPLLYKYSEYSKIKKMESLFPRFLRDVTGKIATGMTLPQAIKAACANDYDVLTPYLKEMDSKISWGIPFERVLKNFAKKTKSSSLKRTVQTIIEAHRSGGTMTTVLEAVVESMQELERIKKERSTSIYSQMLNGYLIFIVFLGVMVGLSGFLIPAFNWETSDQNLVPLFNELFRNLIIIQGLFAGLAIGKMAEGTFIGGVKHSLVLIVVGYSVFLVFG